MVFVLLRTGAGKRPCAGTIYRSRRAEFTPRHLNHSNRLACHVKKLDTVTIFLARHDMAFDQRADISGTQALFRQVNSQNHILV